MRLENLYSSFCSASPPLQAKYVASYRLRRAEDMAKEPTWPKVKKAAGTRKKQSPLSTEEKALMSLLGLKKKDVVAMRNGLV